MTALLRCGKIKFTLVDYDVYEVASLFKWHVSRQGYVVRSVWEGGKNRFIYLHKIILSCPKGKQVDHIDGNKLNNLRKNLRICNHCQNMKNMKRNKTKKTSRFKGVYPYGTQGKWRVMIQSDGVKYSRYGFFTEKEAALAYNFMAKKLHKQFACLNKI